ncbi:protein NDUFAF4 homolog [Pectinophora gossypiella]|uniref:protein NDUFAF4 homolog n=1 Tax=Pectinophora gossypiella TaxID=13191 RepID=UPI00214EA1E6|nr:protein NDUFAF4 homolog [Pectinophora gossypiella]
MGALVTRAIRPLKAFNIENRAHRVISKEKPIPAPKYPQNLEDIKRAEAADPHLDEKLETKNEELDARLRDIYVTATGRPEDDITREKQKRNPNRPLPEDRKMVEDYELGFKEPERIPYGRTTLRHAITFISAHQMDPEEATAEKIANEYKLKKEDVDNILKYYKSYEVYIPATKSTPAVFAGPASMRKQFTEYKLNIIDGKSESTKKETDSNIGKIEFQNKN